MKFTNPFFKKRKNISLKEIIKILNIKVENIKKKY
tara:strand:- start:864 stop:968 length:105 start_codon:yes stop_codon:yes gene_type:complete